MKIHKFQILSAALVLLFIASASLAQRSKKPVIVKRVRSETAPDAKLEEAIGIEEEGARYYYNRVDLNGDGKPEVLVYLFGKGMCGTGGCDVAIFQLVKGEYKSVSGTSLVWNPIIVSEHKTHGWNDLIAFVSGGGIIPGYYTMLRFNGRTYPENATVEPAVPLKTRVKGIAYLVGSASAKSGLALRAK